MSVILHFMDSIDELLDQWGGERPDLDTAGMGITVRVDVLAKHWQRGTAAVLKLIGLKLWEYDVLAALRRQGIPYAMPATALANAAMLSSGAMTTRIDQLEDKGWVERKSDPHDRRGVLVGLTETGVTFIDQAIEARAAAANEAVAGLTQNQQRSVESLLRKLMRSN